MDFTAKRFTDETAAREHLETLRWPNGPVCPHCGGVECNSRLTAQVKGKGARPGLLFCGDCRTQFSVTVGSVFERSKIPLHKWVLATHLLCASKKGLSSHQLHRMLGVTYKTAWFMSHRIREAFTTSNAGTIGSGKIVEADETGVANRLQRFAPVHSARPLSVGRHSLKMIGRLAEPSHPDRLGEPIEGWLGRRPR